MAQTENRKRPPLPLTLAAQRRQAEALIFEAFRANPAGNPTGSLPAPLSAGLPEGLPAPPEAQLGRPLDLCQASRLIGCSPWTVRQKLLLRGLPHFRSAASGKLIFYEAQIVRWIESQQKRGGIKR
jgi:hypothetical protein